MIRKTLVRYLSLVLLLGANLSLVACSASPEQTSAEDSGSVSAALVATGEDGSSYAFPVGSRLTVHSDGGFREVWDLAGAETAVTLTLPVGTFQAELELPSGVLLRTREGITEEVEAKLQNAPIEFRVESGRTTLLALEFRVEDLCDIKFSVGDLALKLDVNSFKVDTFSKLWEQGEWTLRHVTVRDDLAPLLALSVGQIIPQTTGFVRAGDWYIAKRDAACVPIVVHDEMYWARLSAPFSGLIAKLQRKSGQFCIFDYGSRDFATLDVTATDIESPPLLREQLPGRYDIQFGMFFDFATELFDGRRVNQAKLQALSLRSTNMHYRLNDPATRNTIVDVEGRVEGKLRLSPAP